MSESQSDQEPTVRKEKLEMEQWLALSKAGADIPVTTVLYGVSMMPLIRYKKDPVTIIPLKREPVPGDVVLFRRQDGAFVVHRFYRFCEDGFHVQTWGDNCLNPDNPVLRGDVIGLAVSFEKNGRKILLDTNESREKGVEWMKPSLKRKMWFFLQTPLYVYRRMKNTLKKLVS